MTPTPPSHLTDWLGHSWTPDAMGKAAHPNGRFTTPAAQCPVLDPAWQDPQGVPISAIIFGGRRSTVVPLVYEALSWAHGTFTGASVSSEMTAAAKGVVGKLRHDPFAMLPFCGYNMGDYFAHWLKMGEGKKGPHLPRIYHVNWFRKDASGKFLWPGFGENARVLKWIFERTEGDSPATLTPIGYVPTKESLDLSGLSIADAALQELLSVDTEAWKEEAKELASYFSLFGSHLPDGIRDQLNALRDRFQ